MSLKRRGIYFTFISQYREPRTGKCMPGTPLSQIYDIQKYGEQGWTAMENDSDISRFAQHPGHRDSDLTHILVPSWLVPFYSGGTVTKVHNSMSDHSIVTFEINLPETVPTVLTSNFRISAFEDNIDKQEDFEGKSDAYILSSNIFSNARCIRNSTDCEAVMEQLNKLIKRSLNEAIVKHSAKTKRFCNLPSLLNTHVYCN